MNQEKKDNKEKLSLLERVHQLDLRKTYKRLIYFGIAGAILLIGAFLLANKIFSLDLNLNKAASHFALFVNVPPTLSVCSTLAIDLTIW